MARPPAAAQHPAMQPGIEPPAGAGHNQPPEPTLDMDTDAWTAWMAENFATLTERRDALIASFLRFKDAHPEIPNDDIQGRAGDLRAKLSDVLKQADALHTIAKAPILTAQRAVDGFYKGFCQPIEDRDGKGRLTPGSVAPINLIVARTTAYANRQEQIRRDAAQAEADRLAAEARAAAAAAAKAMEPAALDRAAETARAAEDAQAQALASPAELSRTHGMASVTSLRTRWQFFPERSDLMTLVRAVAQGRAPIEYLSFNDTRIGTAVRSDKVREIPGCIIEEVRTT